MLGRSGETQLWGRSLVTSVCPNSVISELGLSRYTVMPHDRAFPMRGFSGYISESETTVALRQLILYIPLLDDRMDKEFVDKSDKQNPARF
jgi:hypothetical protein